jgi:hypothetical protein
VWNKEATQCFACRFDVISLVLLERLLFSLSSAARYFIFIRMGICARASCMVAIFEPLLRKGER